MYQFVCSNDHKSYSASKEQIDSSCPKCGEPTHPTGVGFEVVEVGSEYEPQDSSIIWSHGYAWTDPPGDYAKLAGDVSEEKLIALVQSRARKDGEWSIENGHVGDDNENEDVMRKMMDWVSRPDNIRQCAQANPNETVEWVCRDLANGSKWVAGSDG
jgi:hypothetical protein